MAGVAGVQLRAVAGCPLAQRGAACGFGHGESGGPSPQGLAARANMASALSVQSQLSSEIGQQSRAWACEIPEMRRSEGDRWSRALAEEAPALAARVRWVGCGWALQLSPSCPISGSWQG